MNPVSASIALFLILNAGIVRLQECGRAFNNDLTRIQFQGPPGKSGPPGKLDYGHIMEIILGTLKTEMASLKNEIITEIKELMSSEISAVREEMDAKVQTIREDVDRVWTEMKNISGKLGKGGASEPELSDARNFEPIPITCDITHKEKCYWIVLNTSTTFPKAVELCKENSGGPAGIYDREHYDVIMDHVRQVMGDLDYIDLWLGMKVNPTEKLVTQPGGTIASFFSWYPYHPLFSPTSKNIIVRVRGSKDSIQQGMFEHYPSSVRDGAICEL